MRGAGVSEEALNGLLGATGLAPVVMVDGFADLLSRIRTSEAPLLIIALAELHAGDFSLLEQELRQAPSVRAIGTAPTKDADLVLSALRAGVTEFLVTPAETDALRAAVQRVVSLSAPMGKPSSESRVYTVYSAKGGLGNSTVAMSLAWTLAQRTKRPVAFVDFTSTGAGARVMLRVQPLYDMGSIASNPSRIDREFLRSVLVPHPSGVHVLAAPDEIDAADPLDATSASRLLEVLRLDYPYIVVDVDHHFSDGTLAGLDAADRILLVTQLDVPALRSTQRSLGVFTRLNYDADRVAVLLNRRNGREQITVSDAERVLGHRVDFKLPNDYESCSDAITQGAFVGDHAPASPFVAAVATLAATLTGGAASESEPEAAAGSRLRRLFGRR
jgi:pilus assembly protein CpaE